MDFLFPAIGLLGLVTLSVVQANPTVSPKRQQVAQQKVTSAFKHVRQGDAVPTFSALSLSGAQVSFRFTSGKPCVLVFLKSKPTDTKTVLEMLRGIAQDSKIPETRVVIIGERSKDPKVWLQLAKGLPPGIEIGIDDGHAAQKIGVATRPCFAVLDKGGKLFATFVLYDEGLPKTLRRTLIALEEGRSAPTLADKRKRKEFQALEREAQALESAGEMKKALAIRDQQLDLDLRSAQVHARMARIILSMGHAEWALDHLKTSLELEDRLPVRVLLGKCYFEAKKYGEAKKVFLSLIDMSPNKADIHWYLARIDRKQGELDSALERIKKAIHALRRGHHDR